MMLKTDITICSQNKTAPIHALFVGNRPVSGELAKQLNQSDYLWDCVSGEEFNTCIHSRSIMGTVVIDGEVITDRNSPIFRELFKQLDQKDVSIILYNTPDHIKTDDLPLASKVHSVEYTSLWGRIESSIKYFNRLQSASSCKNDPPSESPLNEDTARQLEMAGRVQRNFLPTRLPHTQAIRWATMFRPAEWVSGDIYDIARLDEEHIGFYLADAVGHSMPAALLTMFLKQATVMRQTINNEYTIFKPWEVMATLNLRMSEQELSGCLFATCFYGLLNIRTLQLQYARAGHPYPVLIRDNKLVQLQSRGGLLGVFPEADFEQQTVQLRSGDKLFVFSDGAEPLLGTSDEHGQFRFNEAFSEICRLPVDPMIEALSNAAKEYPFKPGEIDDVTAVAMEVI